MDTLQQVRRWSSVLDKPPSVCSLSLYEFYENFLENDSINCKQKYQRGRFRHPEKFVSNLLLSIMTYSVVMPILLYRYSVNDDRKIAYHKWEAVDGGHRITTIDCFMKGIYIQCEKKRKIMPYIFHEPTKSYIFYKQTTHTEEWSNFPENRTKSIHYMTPEERDRFNNFEIGINKITSTLSLDARRQIFIKIQRICIVTNNDLYKNYTHLPAIKNIMDNNLDELFAIICQNLDKDITQYSTQWLTRFWLISSGFKSPRECICIKDSNITEILETTITPLVNCTIEQQENFVKEFERFFQFFENMKEYIKFSPIALYAIFERLRNAKDDTYDNILKTHISKLSTSETKIQRKMWEPTYSGNELAEYFDIFLAKLYDIKEVAEPERVKEPRKAIPLKLRNAVWKLYFGDEENGRCFCCATEIYKKASEATKSWNCGHVVSDHDGGELTEENMRPVCFTCNQKMKTENMMIFKDMYYPNL